MELNASRINDSEALLHKGRYVNTTFLLEVGDTPWLVTIAGGRVAELARGPFVMPRWTFALRAPEEAWAKFWSTEPIPAHNDLMALLKLKLLKAEGDLHPFMANLLYFKAVVRMLGGQS